jgi:sugar phosphate isomerase/epimerase
MQLGSMPHLLKGTTEADRFNFAKRLGLDGIELTPSQAQLRDPVYSRDVLAASRNSGVLVPSLCLGHLNDGGLAQLDTAKQSSAVEDIRHAIALASNLSAKVILLPFFFAGDFLDPDAPQRTAAHLRTLCPLAAQLNITLAFEGTLTSSQLHHLASLVSAPNFGVYFDLANPVWLGMDTATEIRGLGPLIKQVHIKDTRVLPWDASPGLGRVNYAESAKALADINYNGWLVLETPAGPETLLRRDIAFSRRLFPNLPRAAPRRFGAFSPDLTSADELLNFCHTHHLTALQLAGKPLASLLENPANAQSFRNTLESGGVQIVALAGYRNLIHPDPKTRAANLDHIKACLHLAPHLGIPLVATESGTLNPTSDWTGHPLNYWDGYKAFLTSLDELLPVAKSAGAVLALEAYVNNAVQNLNHVQGCLDRAASLNASPHLSLVLDPFNYLWKHLLPAQTRHTQSLLTTFEPHFHLAHLKDVSPNGAEHDTPQAFAGCFDYTPYTRFLRETRPDLPLIAEHLPEDALAPVTARFAAMLA